MRSNCATFLSSAWVLLAAFFWSGASAATVCAQQSTPLQSFSANRFHPAVGPDNFIAVDGAQVADDGSATASLLFDYALAPLSLAGADDRRVLSSMATGHFMGSLRFADRLQVGFALPLSMSHGDQFTLGAGSEARVVRGGQSFGPGDPRVSVKAQLFGDGKGLSAAVVAVGTVPLHQLLAVDGDCQEQYCARLGEAGPTVGGHAVVAYDWRRLHLAANLGGIWRPSRRLASTQVAPQLLVGVAGRYDVTPLLGVLAELTGGMNVSSQISDTIAEARLASVLRQGDFVFTLGGGAGLIHGVGVPLFRGLAGLSWQPRVRDSDGDGIPDAQDRCPSEPEDFDGFQDADGCPDSDNDGDGIPDSQDRCPNLPEDMDGFQDADGCPDEDNDGDGILDGYDSCPNEAEDFDGFEDEDGCPDFDRDRDGIPDDVDRCPDEPEDTDGIQDADGCPEDDADGDGIPDDHDLCPETPEDFDGFEDEDGCPEDGASPTSSKPKPQPARIRD